MKTKIINKKTLFTEGLYAGSMKVKCYFEKNFNTAIKLIIKTTVLNNKKYSYEGLRLLLNTCLMFILKFLISCLYYPSKTPTQSVTVNADIINTQPISNLENLDFFSVSISGLVLMFTIKLGDFTSVLNKMNVYFPVVQTLYAV